MKKCLVVGVVCCLMLVSIPIVVGNENISDEGQIENNGGLIDNIPFRCTRTDMLSVTLNFFLTILNKNNPVTYIGVSYSNRNDVPVTITEHYRIKTKDGRLIFEESWTVPFKLKPNHGMGGQVPIMRHHLEEEDYLRGSFYMTADYHVAEDDSHKTLLFNGYFYNYGAIIFNPNGKDITNT